MAEVRVIAEEHVKKYFFGIQQMALEQYELAKKARATGLDVALEPECKPTLDLADRCENITGPKGVAKRYRELYKEMDRDRIKAIFVLFKEILENKWTSIEDKEKRLEQAVRTALVLVTEGVVVAPLDGVSAVKISKNFDDSEYVDIYYAGPIRAAGGTATVFPLILGDYAKKLFGLDRFKPTEEEIERYVEEVKIYQDEIVSRQYKMSDEEVRKIVRGCPVCVNGDPTEEKEVSVYRELERFPSNRIRGAMCLVMTEGVALKAAKILKYAKTLGLDWSWLEQIIKVTKKDSEKEMKIAANYKYLDRIAAGRPIFAYPLRAGGFRLRYGRGRNTGLMGKAIHPATMLVLDNFIAVGTQMKVERPGKSAGIFPCSTIEGPIVKLSNESVVKIKSPGEAEKILPKIKEVLFLGDMLISYGDYRKTAHPLIPCGYCEEWWALELEKALGEKGEKEKKAAGFAGNPFCIDCFQAIELCREYGVPLHPKFTHYYSELEFEELELIAKKAREAEKVFEGDKIEKALFEYSKELKKAFEKIGLEHWVEGEKIVVGKEQAYAFLKTFGALSATNLAGLLDKEKSVFENLKTLSGLETRDKKGTFIGARMGRPESAKPRKMTGNPHTLFPIGIHGGSTRSMNKAMQSSEKNGIPGIIEVEIAMYSCPSCKKTTPKPYCFECNKRTDMLRHCKNCASVTQKQECEKCGEKTTPETRTRINVEQEMLEAAKNLKTKVPELVKGVRGLFSREKRAEPIEKGLLRAAHDLHIFKDGTIRFEMLNAPLSHFKPKELGTSIEKLKEMGYEKDWAGKKLESADQTVELFVQDVVVNEDAMEFMLRVTQFIDDLLVRFYGLPAYYNYKKKEELIGELVLGLAPHTSAAIVGRIIGSSKARVGFAHPFFHLCKRRNIDGDQDSVMLLMDALLNFSEHYLAGSRGSRMDAPLVFTTMLDPTEIDDEAYEMETCTKYPLEFYEKAQKIVPPEISSIPRVYDKLGKKEQYNGLNFTHDTAQFDEGPKVSRYVELKTMQEKIERQARLQGKLAAIDKKDALERVLLSHFLPDIIGNTRAFSRQNFRCTKCNSIYRRIPLVGRCTNCGGNIILTIAKGSVMKYLEISKKMVAQYGLSNYLKQRLDLIEQEIASVFQNPKKEQKKLFEYV